MKGFPSFSVVCIVITNVFVDKNNGVDFFPLFEEKFAEYIELASTELYTEEEYNEDLLVGLNVKERKTLCVSAYYSSKLPIINDEYVLEAEVFRYKLQNEEEDFDVAMKCPTLPPVYLRFENLEKSKERKMWIIFDVSFVNSFSFDIELVQKMIPVSYQDIEKYNPLGCRTWDEDARNNPLYITEPKNYWHLCFTAASHIHQNVRFSPHVDFLELKIYITDYKQRVAFMAMDCKTTPSMYLRVKHMYSERKTVQIILVESALSNFNEATTSSTETDVHS